MLVATAAFATQIIQRDDLYQRDSGRFDKRGPAAKDGKMSQLAQQLQDDLKAAMRSSDTTRRDVIRYLRSEIHNTEIERGRPLDDDEIIAVVRRQIKQRQDAIEQFARGGRQDLVDDETAQIGVLEAYLPPQMSAEELSALADSVATELGVSSPKDVGKVIGAMRERVGARADGRAVAAAAQQAVASRGNG